MVVNPTSERILDATLLVLARHGSRKLSMSDVSEAAGVSRPTLYRYYATREDLLRALADHEQRRFDDGLAAAIAGARSHRERLAAALDHIVAFLEQGYPARHAIEVDPAFILERLTQALPAQRRALERSLGDALAAAPAVRSGATTPGDLAELLLRVAMSHFLLPSARPEALRRTMRAVAGIKSERPKARIGGARIVRRPSRGPSGLAPKVPRAGELA